MAMRTIQENILIKKQEGNPFANYNGRVEYSRFVGRRKICTAICERALQGGSVSIVGLPRIGKTSILQHCFIDKQKELFEEGCITVSLSAYVRGENQAERSLLLWKNIIEAIYDALKPIRRYTSPDDLETIWALEDIDEEYQKRDSKDINTITNALPKILKIIKEELCKKIVICIDEFQNVEEYFEKSDFATIRHISDNLLAAFVVASRKSIEVIELCCQNHDSSYFYNTFKEFVISVFSKEDEQEYWDKNIGSIPVSHEFRTPYIDIVKYFSGSHPCLLNLVNYQALEILKVKNGIGKEDLENSLVLSLEKDLNYQVKLLKEEGLLNTAIKVIKGPFSIKDKNKLQRLSEIGFIKHISAAEKYEMFNMEVGPTFPLETNLSESNKYGYVCFSNYLTYLFFQKYQPEDLPYYQLWDRTENKLRELLLYYVKEKYGDDSLQILSNFKEKWIDDMYADITSSNNPYSQLTLQRDGQACFKTDIWLEEIKKLEQNKKKQVQHFRHQAQLPLIKFTMTGQIYYQFIDTDWDWFKNVFNLATSLDWYNNVFYHLLKIRNAYQHNNIEAIPEQDFAIAENLCNEILSKIDKFFLTVANARK